jgi:hypothetical protein
MIAGADSGMKGSKQEDRFIKNNIPIDIDSTFGQI